MVGGIDYPFELLTERLAIRSPAVEHAAPLHRAIVESIESLRPWMRWADHVPTPAELEENCARAAEAFRNGTDYRLHTFLRDSGLLAGGASLHRFDWSVPRFEIGYWLRDSARGRGYVTEAVGAIAAFAFDELGAQRVEIHASSINERSCRVPERLGFTLEGVLRSYARHCDGTLEDTRVYAKIREG